MRACDNRAAFQAEPRESTERVVRAGGVYVFMFMLHYIRPCNVRGEVISIMSLGYLTVVIEYFERLMATALLGHVHHALPRHSTKVGAKSSLPGGLCWTRQ